MVLKMHSLFLSEIFRSSPQPLVANIGQKKISIIDVFIIAVQKFTA